MLFGRALQRVFSTLVHAHPRYGPVHLAKLDVADGFYRVWLQPADIPMLAVALPTSHTGVPLVLPMGWVQSPPFFTSLTETACDRANAMLSRRDPCLQQVHRLEAVADTLPDHHADEPTRLAAPAHFTTLQGQGRPSVSKVDVHVDDILLMAQTRAQQQSVMRAALNAMDEVVRPLDADDSSHRKESASVKKMLKGDAW